MTENEPERAKRELEAAKNGEDPNALLDKIEDESPTRASSALALRISGASYTEIAKFLGYSSAYRARAVVERVLAETADSPEDAAKQRVLADRRYSRVLQSLMGRATNPKDPEHLPYARTALAFIERIGKLYGVDAPAQAIVYTPDTEKIEQYIAGITAMYRAEEAAEADIIDVEPELD